MTTRRKLIRLTEFDGETSYIDPDEVLSIFTDGEKSSHFGNLTVLHMRSGVKVYLKDPIEIVADAINETRDQ